MAKPRALSPAQEQKVRDARANGTTQSELAEKYNVSVQTIRNIERRED
jgi:DNA-binding XRE family transcriptional regulator